MEVKAAGQGFKVYMTAIWLIVFLHPLFQG